MTVLEDIEGYTAYQLAGMADCASPDSLSSPGAKLLEGVRDEVSYLIRNAAITLGDFDGNGQLHQVADGGPSVYTDTLWREFVDLAAYTEEPEWDDTWGTDLSKAAATALYQICSRLAFALAEEWRDGWECPVCGAEVDSGCDDVDGCGNPAGALVGMVSERLATLAAGEPDDTADGDGWTTQEQDGSFTAIDIPKGWVPTAVEALPVRTPGAAMAEVGEPVSDVLTGPVDLPPVSDPILSLIDQAEATDMGIRVARRALVADRAVSRFRRKVWTAAAFLAVVGVALVMWKGGVW